MQMATGFFSIFLNIVLILLWCFVYQVPALHADVPSRLRLPATGADGEPFGAFADIRWSNRKTSDQQRGDRQQKENPEETENGNKVFFYSC